MSEQVLNGRALVKPGAALKALRLARGWSLAEVSRRTGIPVSSLSKVENDKMELTLEKLMRVSVALDADIAGLFTPPSAQYAEDAPSGRRSVDRAGEGRIVKTPIGDYRYLAYELINKRSIPITIDVTARTLEEFGSMHRHIGEELLYVLEGEVDLYTSLYLPVSLKRGDSIYFDSNMGHAYIATSDEPCRILTICIAPEAELIKLLEGNAENAMVLASKGVLASTDGS
ncbi:MAG: helix-turn-helix domain-containing protein [Phenylobacterium sp.]